MLGLMWFAVLCLGCYVINKYADKLGDFLGDLGQKMKLPSSVRGATLDGASSSIPELLTSMKAALMTKGLAVFGIVIVADATAFADVGIGTIGGSAMFNLLVIPFLSLLFVSKEKLEEIEIDKKAMLRDITIYVIAILLLLVGSYLGKLGALLGAIMTAVYVGYIFLLKKDVAKASDEEFEEIEESYKSLIGKSLLCLIPIGIAVHFCVAGAEYLGLSFGIPMIIMGLIVLASVTSIPDALLSIKSAKNGQLDASISNAVGSNSFDILICLGFVLMITGLAVPVVFSEVAFIFVGLLVSAVFYTVAFYFNFSKVQKLALLATPYIGFIGYILLNIGNL